MLPYIAGLIAGDGHIEQNGRAVIATSDKEFLLKIDKLIQHKKSIFFDKSAGVWKISVNSKEFTKQLTDIGIKKGNKTETVMKINLKDDEIRQFISGLYDAEGHFEVDRRKGCYFKIRIKMKNSSLMEILYEFLSRNDYQPTQCKKDGCIVVDINRQRKVRKFVSEFMLFHSKWGRLRDLLSEAEGLNFRGYTRPTMRRTMGCNTVR